jgi:hypothetical protein
MESFIIAVSILVLALGCFLSYRRGTTVGYWRGRGSGWVACENMVMSRAAESEDYDRDRVWKDLLQ